MIKRKRARTGAPSVAQKAERALRIAVANTIEDHRRTGDPIVVWQNGKIVKIPASRIPRRKMTRH